MISEPPVNPPFKRFDDCKAAGECAHHRGSAFLSRSEFPLIGDVIVGYMTFQEEGFSEGHFLD